MLPTNQKNQTLFMMTSNTLSVGDIRKGELASIVYHVELDHPNGGREKLVTSWPPPMHGRRDGGVGWERATRAGREIGRLLSREEMVARRRGRAEGTKHTIHGAVPQTVRRGATL